KFAVDYAPKIPTKQNLVDTIAMAAASTPFFALSESMTRGDAQSIEDRVLSLGISLLINPAILGVRKFGSTKMELQDKKDWKQTFFDSMYLGVITAAGSLPLYFKNSDQTLTDNLVATVGAGLIGGISGPFVGYFRDTFSDMWGLEECNRLLYPSFVKNKSQPMKRLISAGLVAASLAVCAGIYKATPDKERSAEVRTQDKPSKSF
ncbi:MAG TPA: hypothetical protein VKE88_00790, partial [Candidatus Nanoarchaeia archaeon]|nr:hypothetical protein [Candidatus Nanoarchaeia archaeon]